MMDLVSSCEMLLLHEMQLLLCRITAVLLFVLLEFFFFAFLSVATFLPVIHHELLLLQFKLLNVFFCEFAHEDTTIPDAHGWYSAATSILRLESRRKYTRSMLLALMPLALVDAAVRPLESALPMLKVIEKVTFVLATIRPAQLAPSHAFYSPARSQSTRGHPPRRTYRSLRSCY